MGRNIVWLLWSLLFALFVGYLNRPAAAAPHALPTGNSRSTLRAMMSGRAYQPFVRRRLVPLVLDGTDMALPQDVEDSIGNRVQATHFGKLFLFPYATARPWDSLLWLILAAISFFVFAVIFDHEALAYAAGSPHASRTAFVFTALACLSLAPLFHNNYIYDPPTLAFAALTMMALRKESLLGIVLVTAGFTLNRETAFLVPPLAFLYWLYNRQPRRAFLWAAVSGAVYFAIELPIVYVFRNNPGDLAEDNMHYLIHLYLHKNLPHAIFFVICLVVYAVGVFRYFSKLPAALKAIQWFVLPWIAMHIKWGWPMEWRVFFEILPGVALTSMVIWICFRSGSRRNILAESPTAARV
jgi:hypothetical protein